MYILYCVDCKHFQEGNLLVRYLNCFLLYSISWQNKGRCYKTDILCTSFKTFIISNMTAKPKFKTSFTPDGLGDLWQWERRKRALGHSRKPISHYAVSAWVFFTAVIKILLLNCQRHKIPISLLWVWSVQSFPPWLAPEAASIFSGNGILGVVYSNYRTIGQRGIVPGKLVNSLLLSSPWAIPRCCGYCPVQWHRNSSDALGACQPTWMAIAVIKMFPATAKQNDKQ